MCDTACPMFGFGITHSFEIRKSSYVLEGIKRAFQYCQDMIGISPRKLQDVLLLNVPYSDVSTMSMRKAACLS